MNEPQHAVSQSAAIRCHIHPLFGAHDPGPHPERPQRYAAVLEALRVRSETVVEVAAEPALRAAVEAVHEPAYVDALERFCRAGGGSIDADTVASAASFDAALHAAGAAIAATSDALEGRGPAFAFGRPPGHHAEPARAMGFCLLNSAAVASREARRLGAGRVAVVDFDAHHGNGTQAVFWDDPAVLYASIHQFGHGFYPGTGDRSERGGAGAVGSIVNVPLAAGTPAAAHLAAFRDRLLPEVAGFGADVLVVSAGFDAHREDPLCGLDLTAGSFGEIARELVALGPPVAFVLEGGYDLAALRDSVGAVLDACAPPRISSSS